MKQTSSTKRSGSDQAPTLRAEDLARAKLRIGGKPASKKDFTAAAKEAVGKQRVSIMLDSAVIAHFKAVAGERGYQTLINQALRQAMRGEQMEETLRRVIREELHSA